MKSCSVILLGAYLFGVSIGVSFCTVKALGEELSSIPIEERLALAEKVKQAIGFPFDQKGIDKQMQQKINSIANQNYHTVQEKLMEFCKAGVLEETKIRSVLPEILNNSLVMGKLPIEGKTDVSALSTQNPNLDVIEMIAALIVAGRYKIMEDIVPFLEFSQVFYGNINLAFGRPMFILNFSAIESQPDEVLTPGQRLAFWPAANALLKNPEASVPLLITAVNRKNLRKDLRLRAASFLNTIDPDLINDGLMKCSPDIKEELSCIKERGIKWRHSVYEVCRNETEKEKQRKEILRIKLGLAEDADMKEVQKSIDQDLWGQY